MATVIDGKAVAQTIRSEIADEVRLLSQKYGKVPGLAVVIVGNRKDSESYVKTKRKACADLGINSFDIDLPEEVSEAEVIKHVHELNANPDVHDKDPLRFILETNSRAAVAMIGSKFSAMIGFIAFTQSLGFVCELVFGGILVQLPLPKHINEEKVLTEISLGKDVDGFHPLNIGKLAMKGRDPLFLPCTPKANPLNSEIFWNELNCACLELLSRSGVSIKGKRAVVVGRSNIVGLPASLLLLKADATVTIVHSHTSQSDTESIIREADIVIAAAGQAKMIKGSWIKPGAAVIDVGTNSVDDPTRKSGYRLVGDVDFEEASKVAGWITPVPGGVGPMTVTMLLKNTLEGAKRNIEQNN
ncbi:c-1-tetrahydrofolate synthase cytoplasmic-like [Trifolium pratense]|uniref:C-1-tetrahydrofolate synthase cytoplasmic-like n=1 Tax=Trifolium pratense TaxID=57577 RepID=A0A2K3NZG1_TRIPR|nr:c-1-tetrahydrofolate synthase cytoplasmic-like [Trifolium pratense]